MAGSSTVITSVSFALPAGIPLVLLAAVLVFLHVEDAFDRKDPKLAKAPMYADPRVDFPPAPAPVGPEARPGRPGRHRG